MLFTIHKGNVACDGGQGSIVHLVSTVEDVAKRGLGFTFSDGHGIMAYTTFYDDLADLDAIDWDLISARYWHDTAEDGDRKRRRQAEFLVHHQFPWNLVKAIVVHNESAKQSVQQMISRGDHQPGISARPDWYY